VLAEIVSRSGDFVKYQTPSSLSLRSPETFIDSGPLGDGTICDVIEPTPGVLRLVQWDGVGVFELEPAEASSVASRTEAAAPDPSWVRACRFPRHVGDALSAQELWEQLDSFVEGFIQLDEADHVLLLAFIWSSWFADVLPLAPTLWAAATELSERIGLLRLLHQVCRRPLLLRSYSPNTLLPDGLQPTVLAPIQPSKRTAQWLESSVWPGFYAPHAAALKDSHCARGLVSGELATSAAPLLEIALTPGSVSFPLHIAEGGAKAAENLQANLLRYRLANYLRLSCTQFEPSIFGSPQVRELAACLGTCLDDDALRAKVLQALRPTEEARGLDRAADLHAIVVEALLVVCHEKRPEVLVGELTATANAILAGRGEPSSLEPRQVGAILGRLGFTTTRLGKYGRGLPLQREIRARAHQLAAYYQVCSMPQPACDECIAYRQQESSPSVASSVETIGNQAVNDAHGAHDVRGAQDCWVETAGRQKVRSGSPKRHKSDDGDDRRPPAEN
jgi:hypothetical protein